MFLKDWTVLIPIATLIVIAVGLAHGITTSMRTQRRLQTHEPPARLEDNAFGEPETEAEQEEHAAPK